MDKIQQQQINEIARGLGRVESSVQEMCRLQSDVVALLRAHDKTASIVETICEQVDKHENELKIIREERIASAAKLSVITWVFKNWKNVASVLSVVVAGALVIAPESGSIVKDIKDLVS